MAYVRCKTIKGNTYRYLVKSVREGKRVRQVFVSYIGNPPPASGGASRDAVAAEAGHDVIELPDFTPLMGAGVRVRYVMLLRQLGCPSVVFSLRARHKHGEIQGQRHLETGKVSLLKVRLHRDASVHAIAHEVGHVLDYVLQNAHVSGGSLDAGFLSHTETLRKLADYTCAHHETSSPDYIRRLKAKPATPSRRRSLRYLERYYKTYGYRAEELFARLVAVSFAEPDKARAMPPRCLCVVANDLGSARMHSRCPRRRGSVAGRMMRVAYGLGDTVADRFIRHLAKDRFFDWKAVMGTTARQLLAMR